MLSRVPIAFLLLLRLSAAAGGASIVREGSAFKVVGWKPGAATEGESVFAVYAGDGDAPPMLGSYSMENGALTFRPRFPPAPGVRIRAVFHPPAGATVEAVFESDKPDLAATTRVDHVYPSSDVLPDNQLKFYVHFSAPMRRGDAWQLIHLLRQDGKPVLLPFLEVDQELWDRDYQRLTVLFDPGRIKRGLLPLDEVGPAIEDGKQYTLVIDQEWRDARGVPLAAGFRKVFRAGPADRTPPDPAQWRVTAPRAGTREALAVDFPKPLDYALLMRMLQVPGVDGTAAVTRGETQWRFTPSRPWRRGDYTLAVDNSLEDLAGNRIGRPFDVDTFERVSEHLGSQTTSVAFRIGEK